MTYKSRSDSEEFMIVLNMDCQSGLLIYHDQGFTCFAGSLQSFPNDMALC